ncbi:MAG: tail fiber domain-containing protein [Candidatus Delongbacteria bacterium]|nr:tail fiber domain-containing protein [Candidatus Delongbacteria bacterium]
MRKYIIYLLVLSFLTVAETLFEVKDASNNTVFNISNDGLRVFNLGDTLMVISADAIRANIGTTQKGLSRSFSVTTTSSVKGKGLINALEVDAKSATMTSQLGQYTDFSPDNIFIGLNAGINNDSISGFGNVFLGNNSGVSNASGSRNVFIGSEAGLQNINGSSNIFIGPEAGKNSINANWNIFVGYKSGMQSSGYGNTFVGYGSGFLCTAGEHNSFYGLSSGAFSSAGSNNCYFGYSSGLNNKNGNSNTVFGHNAGIGIDTLSTSYSNNCLFGESSGKSLKTGSRNVMVGDNSGTNVSIGNNNVLMGYISGYKLTSGVNNVFIGTASGYNNETGVKNIFIGDCSGYNETGSNRFHLNNGYSGIPLLYGTFDSPRTIVVDGTSADNPNSYSFYVNGTAGGDFAWNNLSDKRLKKNIVTIDNSLDIVNGLRGVYYEWNDPDTHEKGRRIGFIAQETSKVLPEVVDETGEYFSMQYAPITALLVEAVKELKKENKELKKELEEIKRILNKE